MIIVGRTVVVALLRVMFYRDTPAFVFDAPSWRPKLAHAFNGMRPSGELPRERHRESGSGTACPHLAETGLA
jgi:hypothetical protein